jgi:LysM repeat protein
MTAAADRGPVCPHLGLVDDPATYFLYPSSAQRCHAKDGRPTSIDATKQAQACLVVEHVRCGRYVPPKSVATGLPMPAGVSAGSRSEPVGETSVRSRRRDSSREPGRREPGRRAVGLALFMLLLIVVAATGIMLGSQLAGGSGGVTPDSATPGAMTSASPPASAPPPSLQPTPAPTLPPATSVQSPAATPAPTPKPTATPKLTPKPIASPTQVTHVVTSGETLWSIAQQHGVTVAALQAANGIKDPDIIVTGQTLVIPAH